MSSSGTFTTTAEVATRLGVSVRQVARLVERGRITPLDRLPGVRGAYLFDPNEVDRVAEERAS